MIKRLLTALAGVTLIGVALASLPLWKHETVPPSQPRMTPPDGDAPQIVRQEKINTDVTSAGDARTIPDSVVRPSSGQVASAPPTVPSVPRSVGPIHARGETPVSKMRDPRPIDSGPSESEPLVPEPVARMALGRVGTDPEAEQVWLAAINDPALDPDSRKNLIEDLNEDGFPDPKHITADDVPLIVNRLQLIEQYAPQTMDEVNAAAFAEAYKDLIHMLRPFSGQ